MSFIDGLANAGATPALEMMMRFAGARQRLIASNIANIDTPGYRQRDLDVGTFQRTLGEAIDQRRTAGGGQQGELHWRENGQMRRGRSGEVRFTAEEPGRGVLFHDRNDRDLERLMQDLVENAGAYRTAAELLRNQTDMVRAAIREAP